MGDWVRKYNSCFLKPQVFSIPNITYMTCITNSKYLGSPMLQNNYLTISPQTLTVGSLLFPCNVQESQKLTQSKGEGLASTFETARVQFDWSIPASVSPSRVLSLGSCPTQGVPVLAVRMPDPYCSLCPKLNFSVLWSLAPACPEVPGA